MATDPMDALVIFGATGDLAKLETFPALVGLVERGVLDVPVIGVAKSGWGLPEFRDYAAASLRLNGMDPDSPSATKLLSLLRYVDGDLDDAATYAAMSDQMGPGGRALFYLEVPPPLFGRIAKGIAGAGRAEGARVMVEKPFGTDLAERPGAERHHARGVPGGGRLPGRPLARAGPARERALRTVRELDPRAAAQPNHVAGVQITMAEAFDVSDRGSFYDRTGAIRDVVQNHMLQVLATVLADPPSGDRAESWLAAKSNIISSLRPLDADHTVRGQYDGYLDVAGVAPGSTTESFVAVRLAVDSWRWADVPIVIRAGKCMPVTATEVSFRFNGHPWRSWAGCRPRRRTCSGSGSGRRARWASRWSGRSRAPAGLPTWPTCRSPTKAPPTCGPTTG